MISDVDEQLGRVLGRAARPRHVGRHLRRASPSDHGEQLGDQARSDKGGLFEASYHIPGIVRDPRHPEAARDASSPTFTENVDVFPTICDAIGIEVPAQCDGMPLTPFLEGERAAVVARRRPLGVRLALGVHLRGPHPWPWDRRLESKHLAVLRTDAAAYVQFGDGDWRCFDLAADPTWRTEITDPAAVLEPRAGHVDVAVTTRRPHAQRHVAVRRRDRARPRYVRLT